MSGKKDRDKKKKVEGAALSTEELQELEMILDRLQVQDPEGESLPNYLRSLRQALADREALAAALIERVGKQPSGVGFQVLLALKDLFQSKTYRRMVKQITYRFAQKGYEEKPAETGPKSVTLVHSEKRNAVAHLIPGDLDVFGMLNVLIPGEGLIPASVMSAVIAGPMLLGDVHFSDGTLKNYREILNRASEHFGDGKPYEVPLWHAAGLFFDALHFMEAVEGDRILGEPDRARHALKPFHEPDRLPYAYELMPPPEESAGSLSDSETDKLLRSIPARGLAFPREELVSYFEKVKEVEHSTLIVSHEVQQERTMAILDGAVDAIITGTRKRMYERTFEEYALGFKLTGEDELAMLAWRTAQHLKSESGGSAVPAVRRMVAVSLLLYWPDEFREQPEHEHGEGAYTKSESGLIIPR